MVLGRENKSGDIRNVCAERLRAVSPGRKSRERGKKKIGHRSTKIRLF